jgi:hypothetical protein
MDTDEFVTRCEHCIKSKIREVVVRTNRDDGVCFKICLNREVIVPRTRLPPAVTTDHFRIIQRRTFWYGPPGSAPNWAYDFSFQWHGPTKTLAEQSQHSERPRYEMEIELVNRDYLARNDDRYVADFAICKAFDFIHRGGPSTLNITLARQAAPRCDEAASASELVDVTPAFMLISDK